MIRRKMVPPPEHIYPVDDWRMVQKSFSERYVAQEESFFAIGNGYLGMRGNCDEGRPVFQGGTFVNGFYESWPIVYGEEAYGFAKDGQTMLNVTDSKVMRLYVDDEPFFLPTARLLHFERALDMKRATLDRDVLWETPSGKRVSIKSCRLISFVHRHLAAICYEVTILNAGAPVVIASELVPGRNDLDNGGDPRRPRGLTGPVLLPQTHGASDLRMWLTHATSNSDMRIACAVDHVVETICPHSSHAECGEHGGKVVFTIDARPGEPIRLIKYMSYHSSRSAPPVELAERADWTLAHAARYGFDALLDGQRQYMDDFWRRSDVVVRADAPRAQQCIRFNLFQLLQASGRAEGAGIGARGLTGHAYEGHYFWDMEMYVLPFLTYTAPRIARNMLLFRRSHLDEARRRAAQVNQRGALFPWRTINGKEASAYYAAGTAQYHINADIMYALRRYVEATGDDDFLFGVGAEMLVETARLWADLGFYPERAGGMFCIHGVTGPDEYNTVVNNNAFTNLMARENLWFAAETIERMQRERPAEFAALAQEVGLKESEVADWRRAADRMYVPFDENLGIHLQDDTFLEKEDWDFENTPAERYPLLLHYHPLVIYRHKVIKQADVVMAMFLLGNEFSAEQKKRNFDYYDPLTTGDSSLSACIQSILALELGYEEKGIEYFTRAVLMDLADVGGNVKDGCHIASMGGTWMAVVYGFAGMRDYKGRISFDPKSPARMQQLRLPLTVRGQRLELNIEGGSVTYLLSEGTGLVIHHREEELTLAPGVPVTRPLPALRSVA